MIIRLARPEDAPGLLEIYTPYVTDTTVTFETCPPTPEEFARRIEKTREKYPYLCAEEDGTLLGYAYASPFHPRAAYIRTAESSLYVRRDKRGRGIGSALEAELERLLRLQRVCLLTACITFPNPQSIAFHLRSGFTECAHFHRCGYKMGQWLDVLWLEKALLPFRDAPEDFLPLPEVFRAEDPPALWRD